ncbi:MAG: hypothetical protein ACLSHC_00975 [Bilophila wadsworthia]
MKWLQHRRQRHRERVRQDLGTGKEQSIQITASSGLSDADIEKLVKGRSPCGRRQEEAGSHQRPQPGRRPDLRH